MNVAIYQQDEKDIEYDIVSDIETLLSIPGDQTFKMIFNKLKNSFKINDEFLRNLYIDIIKDGDNIRTLILSPYEQDSKFAIKVEFENSNEKIYKVELHDITLKEVDRFTDKVIKAMILSIEDRDKFKNSIPVSYMYSKGIKLEDIKEVSDNKIFKKIIEELNRNIVKFYKMINSLYINIYEDDLYLTISFKISSLEYKKQFFVTIDKVTGIINIGNDYYTDNITEVVDDIIKIIMEDK